MALMALADNVRETTISTGASATIVLGGASSSAVRTFVNGVGNGKIVPYKTDDGAGNWENRWGAVVSGTPDTITYLSFISSSTGSAVTFGAGTKTVSLVPMYELFITPAPSPALVETDIASATTTDLGTVLTLRARITGTATITGFGSSPNSLRFVRFAGALTLTYNAASLILLGGISRTTAAGDCGIYVSDGSGNWREVQYQSATPVGELIQVLTASSSASLAFTNLPTKYKRFRILVNDMVLATNSASLQLQFSEDGGSTWKTASYAWALTFTTDSAANGALGSTSDSDIQLTGGAGNAGTLPIILTIELGNPAATGLYKSATFTSQYPSSSNATVAVFGSGNFRGDTNAITAIRLISSSGNIASGNATLEGFY